MEESKGVALEQEDLSFSPSELDAFELSVEDLTAQPGFEYPAMLLHNVLFMDCLRVLQSGKRKSFREIQTWVELPDSGEFQEIGTLQLDSAMLLIMRLLRIGVTVYWDKEHTETLDLEDPARIEEFI